MPDHSKEVQISIDVGVELLKGLIVTIYQGISGFVENENKEPDLFGTANFVGSLVRRYNEVQVLGMREPVPLKSLYVRANILEKSNKRMGLLRPEDLDAFFDFDRRAFGKKQETVDGELIVNKLRKFIVLGKPGAGKTTYLKYLTLMMLDPSSQIVRRKLPVFITLREWAGTSLPLINVIVQQFDRCGFAEAGAFVERMLRDGQCLILFDGLDEIGELSRQDEIIRQIKDFSDKYYDNQFIISCRVAAYNHWFSGFTEIEMADFNEAQMESFISNWFHSEPKVATECWERLKSSAPLRELASIPLLLTLLCLEYGESNDFPINRAELYHRAIETLLTKWDSTRRIRRQEVYKNLSIKRKESMFARIAVGTFLENQYFILERDIVQMIEKFIENLPGFREAELEPDSKAILKSIEAHHGIFVERAKGVYSFAHLTFQEYFTAKYIVDNSREGTIGKLVEQHLHESKWKEVFLLVSGLLDNSDELLLIMHQNVSKALDIPEISVSMERIGKSLLPQPNKYPDIIRTLMAMNLSNCFGDTRAMIDDTARTIDHDLARRLKLDLGSHYDYNDQRDQDTTHAYVLGLDYDMLEQYGKTNNLIEPFRSTLQIYLKANLLTINCMESANFVSKLIREKILHEMFLPKRGEVS